MSPFAYSLPDGRSLLVFTHKSNLGRTTYTFGLRDRDNKKARFVGVSQPNGNGFWGPSGTQGIWLLSARLRVCEWITEKYNVGTGTDFDIRAPRASAPRPRAARGFKAMVRKASPAVEEGAGGGSQEGDRRGGFGMSTGGRGPPPLAVARKPGQSVYGYKSASDMLAFGNRMCADEDTAYVRVTGDADNEAVHASAALVHASNAFTKQILDNNIATDNLDNLEMAREARRHCLQIACAAPHASKKKFMIVNRVDGRAFYSFAAQCKNTTCLQNIQVNTDRDSFVCPRCSFVGETPSLEFAALDFGY